MAWNPKASGYPPSTQFPPWDVRKTHGVCFHRLQPPLQPWAPARPLYNLSVTSCLCPASLNGILQKPALTFKCHPVPAQTMHADLGY